MADKISLEPFLASVQKSNFTMYSVLVYQEGREPAEFYWETQCSCKWRNNIYSASKSIGSLGLGLAIEEGILSLNDRPIDYFGELIEGEPSPFWEKLTLRHLLTMTEGYECKTPSMGWASYERDQIPHWLKNAMNIPVTTEPGTKFHYNNVAPYVTSALFTKKSGQTLADYMKPRIFEPLGILNPQWFTSPEGCNAGAGGLSLTPDELLRVGKLLLQEGNWEGRQLVPAAWIREATKTQAAPQKPQLPPNFPPLPNTPGSQDFWTGYGYYFWVNHDNLGYRAIGNGGQLILVLPEKRAVIVTTANDGQSQMAFMDTIWSTIYPQL